MSVTAARVGISATMITNCRHQKTRDWLVRWGCVCFRFMVCQLDRHSFWRRWICLVASQPASLSSQRRQPSQSKMKLASLASRASPASAASQAIPGSPTSQPIQAAHFSPAGPASPTGPSLAPASPVSACSIAASAGSPASPASQPVYPTSPARQAGPALDHPHSPRASHLRDFPHSLGLALMVALGVHWQLPW